MEPSGQYAIHLTGSDWWKLHEFLRRQLADHARFGGAYDEEWYDHACLLAETLRAVSEAKRVSE